MTTTPARAAASRRNGARSGGPVSAAGKARSARNATKHGLRARDVVVGDESDAAFARFVGALRAELAPAGTLQNELAARVAAAAWRARRADRLEAALLDRHLEAGAAAAGGPRAALGAGLVRDGHGPRALDTLVRYRGSVLAELFRALAALKMLQAEAAALAEPAPPPAGAAPAQLLHRLPDEPAATPARRPNEPGKRF